jgi:hypothetical protein
MILHGLRLRGQPGRTVLGTLGYSIVCMFPWRGWLARWDQRMDLRAQIRPLAQLTLVCLIVALLPWRGLLAERKRLADLRPHALKFLENAATRSDGEAVFGEEMHLYKTKYRNEVVDTGDTASAIARSGYFGKAFNRTFETYVSNLLAQPPRFVMAGLLNTHPLTGTMSPELLNLLSNRYDLVLQSPGTMIANGGTSMALFERKSP